MLQELGQSLVIDSSWPSKQSPLSKSLVLESFVKWLWRNEPVLPRSWLKKYVLLFWPLPRSPQLVSHIPQEGGHAFLSADCCAGKMPPSPRCPAVSSSSRSRRLSSKGQLIYCVSGGVSCHQKRPNTNPICKAKPTEQRTFNIVQESQANPNSIAT